MISWDRILLETHMKSIDNDPHIVKNAERFSYYNEYVMNDRAVY